PGHRQFVDAVGQPVVFERDVPDGDRQRQSRDAPEQRLVDDLQLGPSELLADALMPAIAERDVSVGAGAVQVQPIGFWEGTGIPVGRGQIDDDALAGADGLPRDVNVFQGYAALTVLDDAEVTKQLLHRTGQDLRI